MSQGTGPTQASTLAVDESFAGGDDRFVELVRSVSSPKYLAALVDRWKRDPRPWAREQIIKYFSLPMDRPGHHPVVKRLFKHAEEKKDDELMAHFLVALDRLVRRQRRMRYRYDYDTRQLSQVEVLYAPRNQILAPTMAKNWVGKHPWTGEQISVPPSIAKKGGRLFTYRTRVYLRRRAWRYFRWMGFGRPDDYPAKIALALAAYRDDDFASGENILDNWSLMNIAFYRSQALKITPSRVELADGHSLSELSAAPRFEDLWRKPESAAALLDLVARADSRLVRVWAMQLINRHHSQAMQAVSVEQLLGLLDHADEEVQQFGANLLKSLPTADNWPIDLWLRLLETRSVSALVTICDVMSARVRPERLSLQQCAEMACARATPVAKLGLSWLKDRPIAAEDDQIALTGLADAQCDAVAAEIAEFALSVLGRPDVYQTARVMPFFDSRNAEVRRGAWNWLVADSAAYGDPQLWSSLVETPYDDVKLRLIDELHRRTLKQPGASLAKHDDLAPIWTAVLLNVHRGNRAKLKALRQISEAIVAQPDQAERLVPVLAVAIRSVRPPEVRAGLSAILSAVAVRPELESTLAQWIPELRLSPSGAQR
jgi:hypothetical protein